MIGPDDKSPDKGGPFSILEFYGGALASPASRSVEPRSLQGKRPECWFDELAEPYVFAAGGRRMRMPEAEGLQRFLSGRVLEYLRQPFLCGQTPSYLQDTHLRNLKVLTAGLRVCDLAAPDHLAPFELLLRRLARAFDFVLVDAPPVFPGGPTACMAPLVDGVLIVVGAGDADVPGLRGAVDELRLARANVMGAVLNHAPIPLEPRLVRNGEGPQRS